jgi:hypothetical protein
MKGSAEASIMETLNPTTNMVAIVSHMYGIRADAGRAAPRMSVPREITVLL